MSLLLLQHTVGCATVVVAAAAMPLSRLLLILCVFFFSYSLVCSRERSARLQDNPISFLSLSDVESIYKLSLLLHQPIMPGEEEEEDEKGPNIGEIGTKSLL